MNMSKKIIIEVCDDCPHCEFYNGWNDHSNVLVCEEQHKIIKNVGDSIDKNCPLMDA